MTSTSRMKKTAEWHSIAFFLDKLTNMSFKRRIVQCTVPTVLNSLLLAVCVGGIILYNYNGLFNAAAAASKPLSRGINVVTVSDGSGKTFALYERSYALVVGISEYSNGWPKLHGVKKDVQLLILALEKHNFHITLAENPTSSQLPQIFHNFINTYGMDLKNRLLFFYAGHGYTLKQSYGEEMGYIIPADAPLPEKNNIGGFLSKAIDMYQVEVFAKRIQSKHALFVFDSCFSGSIFSIYRALPASISYKIAEPVRQFITSGSANEEVPDHSIFLRLFINALSGDGDVNGDSYITGSELGLYLQENVVNYSRGTQHPQYGKIRHPGLSKGDFVFLLEPGMNTGYSDQDENQKKLFWQQLQDKSEKKKAVIPLPTF